MVPEHLAHAPDLPVQSLRQNNAKHAIIHAADPAGLGALAENAHAAGHAREESFRHRLVDGHDVFFFVIVLGTQDHIHDVAVVRKQDQPLGVLVQPPDRENPLGMANEIDNVAIDVALGRAGNADGFIQADVDVPLLRADHALVHADFIALVDLRAELGTLAVDGHPAAGDPGIGFAARADSGFTDVFIQSHGRARRGRWVHTNRRVAE